MALAVSTLQAAFAINRANLFNTPDSAAKSQATDIASYWATGLGPGGAAVVAAPTIPTMEGQFSATFLSLPPVPSIAAQQIAAAVDSAALTLLLVGGVYGSHISLSTPGPSGLASRLELVYLSQFATPDQVACEEATAYDEYTKQFIASGSGIPPNIPPQTGPIT